MAWKPLEGHLLPTVGAFRHGIRIGHVDDFRSGNRDICLSKKQLNRSVLLTGRTRMGKTSLALHIAKGSMDAGDGIGEFDMTHDFASDTLKIVPQSRISDVIYFRADDISYPIPINFFALTRRHPNDVTNNLISTIHRLSEESGDQLKEPSKRIFRKALLIGFIAKKHTGSWTLSHTLTFLEDAQFRCKILNALSPAPLSIDERTLVMFWEKYDDRRHQMQTMAVINRLDFMITDNVLGPIFNSEDNRIDFEDIVNNRKIFVLDAGGIGLARKQFLAKLISNELQYAILDRPVEKRAPFLMILDEFHLYYSSVVEEIISQSAKFNAALVLANQSADQIPHAALSMILDNVGTLVTFAVGPSYASALAPRFPGVSSATLIGLKPYKTIVSIEGTTFRMDTYNSPAVGL